MAWAHLEEETKKKRYVFPLLKEFKPEDFNKMGDLKDKNHPLLLYYSREDEPHGNGYCHLKTTYSIINARVINTGKKDIIRFQNLTLN